MSKWCIKALALSFGIVCAIYILLLGWVAAFGWGTSIVHVISSFYIGYAPTFWGAIIGAIWAFVDGAIFGIVLGLFYNLFVCCKPKSEE